MFWQKKKYCVCEICHKKFPEDLMVPIRTLGPSLIPQLKEASPDFDAHGLICLIDMKKLRTKQISLLYDKEGKDSENLEHILFHEEEGSNSYDFNQTFQSDLSLGERISEKVTLFVGSWAFMGLFGAMIVFWMVFNGEIFSHPFDPFPYILLNLFLSCLAAGQAPIILMSQNRLAKREHLRADEDYYTNLKAELEIRQLHEKIDELLKLMKK
jgi:uncharacterized membrane protein